MSATDIARMVAVLQTERAWLLNHESWPAIKPRIEELTTKINHLIGLVIK